MVFNDTNSMQSNANRHEDHAGLGYLLPRCQPGGPEGATLLASAPPLSGG